MKQVLLLEKTAKSSSSYTFFFLSIGFTFFHKKHLLPCHIIANPHAIYLQQFFHNFISHTVHSYKVLKPCCTSLLLMISRSLQRTFTVSSFSKLFCPEQYSLLYTIAILEPASFTLRRVYKGMLLTSCVLCKLWGFDFSKLVFRNPWHT
jgi:hypothetical protein